MTEHSYFHNGSMRGDATEAPYTADLFHSVISQLFSSGRMNGVVSTGSAWSDLEASSAGVDMEIDISSGNAYIEGILFKSDATEVLTLDEAVATNRWDRIIIRVNWNTQQARLAVVKGAEASSPTLPDLQQDAGNIYEISLARVWVDASSKTTHLIPAIHVFDERTFLHTADDPPIINIMPNSEFFGGAHTGVSGIGPAYWWTTNTPTITNQYPIAYANFPPNITSRGNVLDIVLSTGGTLETRVLTSKRSSTIWPISAFVTLAFYIHVTKYSVTFSIDGTNVAEFWPTDEPVLFLLRTSAWSLNSALSLKFAGNAAEFSLYPFTLSYGFIPAPFVPKREFVLFQTPDYIAYTRSTGSDTSIPYYGHTIYGFPVYGRNGSALMRQQIYDSGSAGADSIYAELKYPENSVRTEVGRLPNNTRGYSVGIISPRQNDGGVGSFFTDIVASGASAMTQTVYWAGAII